MKKFKHISYRVIKFLIFLYVVLCAMLYFTPHVFFYYPSSQKPNIDNAHANGYNAKIVEYNSADGTKLFAWYTKPEKGKKIVLFLHGNSYNVESFYIKLVPFAEMGYGTFLPEYRGFGGVKGQITQSNLAADSIAAVKQLHKLGYKNEDIIVYGMSLGSHTSTFVVHELGQKNKFAGLVLEVPFDSLENVVKTKVPFLPVDALVQDKFDNVSMIKDINIPVLILGAEEDTTVPVFLAQNLYSVANEPKDIIIYPGAGHNDLYYHHNYRDIMKWLEQNGK